MILWSNEFHGSLGPCLLLQLRIIDISHNDFTGTLLSGFFMHWNVMSSKGDHPKSEYIGGNTYYQDSMVLVNKGVELKYTRIFTLLTTIDFSRNRLHIKISESIGLLKDLIVLNLSRNSFTRNIHLSLVNLTQLESLDLSYNKLSGQIPPAFKDFTKLSFIKVSHNKLVGPIPKSTQFQTQNMQFQTQNVSSFEENLGLCGLSLEKNCGGVNIQPSQQPETTEEEKEEEEVLSWTVAAIGLAPGVIFGITIGYIVITLKR